MGRSKRFSVCFTGHRPDKVGGYAKDNPTQKAVKKVLLKTISDLSKEHDTITFYSGMALGVDTWAAEWVLLLGHIMNPECHPLRLCAVIPCANQQNKWPPESQVEYMKLIHQADDLYFVDKGPYEPRKLMERNKWMVDHSDLVIAVWDGDPKGGTANCVRYAKKQKKPVINLWSEIENNYE